MSLTTRFLLIPGRIPVAPDHMKTFNASLGILILTSTAWFQVQAQNPPTNGLVAYYPFDGNPNDASGNGNHGSFLGTDKRFIADRPGFSLWLNGNTPPSWSAAGTYVSVPRDFSLNFNSDFTISVWVNFTNSNPLPNGTPEGFPHNLVSNGEDSGALNLRVFTDNTPNKDLVQFIWGGGGSSISVPVNNLRRAWWQITVVRSGANLILYRNGTVLTNSFVLSTANNSTISIGEHQSTSTYPLFGGIDDVRFYSRALSVSEVRQLYLAESKPLVNLIKAVKPTFSNLSLGTNYQLQLSADLNTWTNHGPAFTATNSTAIFPEYWDVDRWNQLYFRLLTVP